MFWDLSHFRPDINNIPFFFPVNTDAVIKSIQMYAELRMTVTMQMKNEMEGWE